MLIFSKGGFNMKSKKNEYRTYYMTEYKWLKYLYRGKDRQRTRNEIYDKCALSYSDVGVEFLSLKMDNMYTYSHNGAIGTVALTSKGLDRYKEIRRSRFFESGPLLVSIMAVLIAILAIIISVVSLYYENQVTIDQAFR